MLAFRKSLQRTANSGPLRWSIACRTATSLPQIPGVVLTNDEIPSDRLVVQVRNWARSSERLSGGAFDLIQLAENTDGRLAARAICGMFRTEVLLAQGQEPVRALVVLFYRARDILNREFWEDQVRRLTDIVADEYLGSGSQRGVQLTVHQNAPAWAFGLEIGDHRLLAEFGALHLLGRPRQNSNLDLNLEFCERATSSRHSLDFHELCLPEDSLGKERFVGSLRCGKYLMRDASGTAVCGVEVLGSLPFRLVCSSAWALEGNEVELGHMMATLRRRARVFSCSLLSDTRDPSFQKFSSLETSPRLASWSTQRRVPVAVTGIPVNLEPEEQARLAQLPFCMPWEFLPFHAGRVMWI